jgi:predicted MFS family arabinose efflux permease
MMASVAPSQYGFVSTAWNLSFDLGIAVGGLGLGLVIAPLGFAGGSTVLAAVMALVVVVFFAPLTRLRRYAGSPS